MSSRIKLFNGISIAFQRWTGLGTGGVNTPRVLCIHGWLDNSNSFLRLGTSLSNAGCDVVAIDHIGNGFSDHYSSDCSLQYLNRITHIRGVLDGLGWDDAIIIGHSMGAGIGMVFAGVFPEMVQKLILLDGFGPSTRSAKDASRTVRSAIENEAKFYMKQSRFTSPKLYETIESAIQARVQNVATYPGKQYISYEAAALLIARGAQLWKNDPSIDQHPEHYTMLSVNTIDPNNRIYTTTTTSRTTSSTISSNQNGIVEDMNLYNDKGPVYFVHDQRQYLPYYHYISVEQLHTHIENIQAPTLFLEAENGWPSTDMNSEYEKMKKFKAPFIHKKLAGSHHFHLDPETAPLVSNTILDFIFSSNSTETNTTTTTTMTNHDKSP